MNVLFNYELSPLYPPIIKTIFENKSYSYDQGLWLDNKFLQKNDNELWCKSTN